MFDYLKSFGIKFTGCYGLILTFNGTVGEIEKAFNTELNVYYYPYKNIYWYGLLGIANVGPFYYFSNNVTPSLPYNIGKYVLGIVGIYSVDPKVYPIIKETWKVDLQGPSLVSSVLVTPSTIAQYFNFTELYSQGYTGKGEKVAIEGVPESFINESDIYVFWNQFYIVPRTGGLNVVYLGNITSSGQSGENELDAEWAGVFSPASCIYVVFSNGYVGGQALVGNLLNYYYELYYMVNYIDPDVISISVALPESYLSAYYPAMLYMIHNIMIQAVDEGISVLAAAGDWGFESDHPPPNFIIDVYNTIWYPESDPYVTAVGGIFVMANSTGGIVSISGWDYSTGGISTAFPIQCYELASLIPFTPKIPQRTYPDIAFVSAGGYNIPEFGFGLPLIYQGQLYLWYGTSGAAPMTAAMVSLAEVRLGMLNSILYHISYCGEILTPKGCIKGLPAWIPITTGANPTPAHYGWNYVTGPGTYDAYAMVKDFLIYYDFITNES
ncbi:peptidase S53 [Acidianus infernus]|uniref:Peptidase S53 n=1 Tax=Acidianus infernus TaxID=12915 RepID=A0A6A9QF99_ACIIN|nr:protease pro-enzyme activation domain-containing protein [Acidianus infernus]MUM64945.1 peptidase S53 [Acidianus infernus]